MSTVQIIKCGLVNCYIVSDGVSGILIDTGKKEYLVTARIRRIIQRGLQCIHTEASRRSVMFIRGGS